VLVQPAGAGVHACITLASFVTPPRIRFLLMPVTPLPAEHPLRRPLADELHARPPTPVRSPAVVSCLALLDAPAGEILATLREMLGETPSADSDVAHIIFERPQLRVKWERHGEFVSLTLVQPLAESSLAALQRFPSAFGAVAPGALARLPGRLIAAADVLLLPEAGNAADEDALTRWFDRNALAGARILDGQARLFTDFVVHSEGEGGGRSRWLVLDDGMGPPQTARLVQRLIEIEVYRMMALLAFPLARAALPQLNAIEQRLAEITAATAALHGQNDVAAAQQEERRLLDELTRLAAEVERSVAATAFRFSAGQAYWDLVSARVRELREARIGDRRTIAGFLSRRLAPAMNSCAAAARRQEELSARIERASALLRTRVDVAREEQNQRLLAAMERRGKISLRMQQTVEGLSVAAITYYGAGLIGYLAKPLKSLWPALNPDWIVAAAIPLLAFGIWRAVHRLRRDLMRD
jgi:uncharacterized membrane-anchored protein